jgi:peptide/nickel transport system substrate-binding protein
VTLRSVRVAATLLVGLIAACGPEAPASCAECGTAVIAATGEPSSLLPPLIFESVGRDVADQVYERLADLAPGAAPIDPAGYRPGLADRWERVDSLTWRFRLRPGAMWQDGVPVTAADVVFSFAAYADSALDTEARGVLEGQVTVAAEDSTTVLVRFARAYPEQLYDATWHVRILPAHIWEPVPRDQWAGDTSLARLVGSGSYRVAEWVRGQSLRLEAAPGAAPPITRVVWRFVPDQDAAVNMLLAGEVDLVEHLGPPPRVSRVAADTNARILRYPSAAYGFLGFRLQDAKGRRHPLLGDRALRRALAMGVDRATLAAGVFGPGTVAPAGPMSQLLWINSPAIRTLPYDTAAARRLLDSLGWAQGADGMRQRRGTPLRFDILVPGTSPARRDLAQALQQSWKSLGAEVTITAVDFPVFNERLGAGNFDSYIGAWLDEPSPRGLADQWTRGGWGQLNFGRYDNPAFDALFVRAVVAADTATAAPLYRAAMDTLNADAPALFLYAPEQAAGLSRRMQGVTIDPYSWLSGLDTWRAGPRQ